MSDNIYIRVSRTEIESTPYAVAEVVLGGEVLSRGEAPDTGVYKADGNAESTAISLAKAAFYINQLNDVRRV